MKSIIFLFFLFCSGLSSAQEKTGTQQDEQRKEIESGTTEISGNVDDTIYLMSPILYAEGNSIRDEIKDECELPTVVENSILGQAAYELLTMESSPSYSGKGKAIRISILDVTGYGGGVYTGSKEVVMHVDLFKDGALIASSDFKRHTIGASWSGMTSGSCAIFSRLIRSFTIQSTKWMMAKFSIKPIRQKGRKSKRVRDSELTEKPAETEIDLENEK